MNLRKAPPNHSPPANADDARSSADVSGRALGPLRVLVPVRYPVGGIRSYLLYNYPDLISGGYRFSFVGPDDGSFEQFRREILHWEGVEFIPVTLDGKKCPMRSTIRRELRTGRYSLIHSQGVNAGIHALAANWSIGVPHAMTSHGMLSRDDLPGLLGPPKRWLLGLLLSRLDVLIAVSEAARLNHLEFLPRLRSGRCRVLAIPNGIDVASIRAAKPATGDLRSRLGIEPGVFLLGFLGRFMPVKGFPLLLEALDAWMEEDPARKIHLVAVGSGDYEDYYKRLVAQRSRVAGITTFLPHVPEASAVLKELDLVVMPSLSEACGLLAMEALVLGVPILASDCPALLEVLGDSPGRTFRSGDAGALARALEASFRERRVEAFREYVPRAEERFDLAPAVGALSHVFGELAAVRTRSANRKKTAAAPVSGS